MFKLSQKASSWSNALLKQQPFTMQFDIYYIFLITGFAAQESLEIDPKDNPDKMKSGDIIKTFPVEFKSSQKLIINLLLVTEKKQKGIADDANVKIRNQLLEKYVDPNSSSLSEAGYTLCNNYANKGFKILFEKILKPTNAADFLTAFLKEIKIIEKK